MSIQQLYRSLQANYALLKATPADKRESLLAANRQLSERIKTVEASIGRDTRGGGNYRPN